MQLCQKCMESRLPSMSSFPNVDWRSIAVPFLYVQPQPAISLAKKRNETTVIAAMPVQKLCFFRDDWSDFCLRKFSHQSFSPHFPRRCTPCFAPFPMVWVGMWSSAHWFMLDGYGVPWIELDMIGDLESEERSSQILQCNVCFFPKWILKWS